MTAAPAMIERAVTNLVDNAVKFDARGPDRGHACGTGGSRWPIAGRASTPADLPARLRPLLPGADARSRPGSGLGLAIVRDVAEPHGGKAFAHRREGGGAAIGFELPVS